MKILFVCSDYCESNDANSQCVHYLRSGLKKININSDVLTYNWIDSEEHTCEDNYGKIYSVKTWYRYARANRNSAGKLQMSISHLALALSIRGLCILLEGKHYVERGVPMASTENMIKRLRRLCQENEYNWIISCSWPFANHKAVVKSFPITAKCILYNLDPYWNNQTYDSDRRDKRAKEEASLYEKVAAVFCTPEQVKDYRRSEFDIVREKIYPLQYPNFCKLNVTKKSRIQLDKNHINLLYLGTFYKDIRRSDALLNLFEKVVLKEPRLHLHIVGKHYDLTEYVKRFRDYMTVYSSIPEEETADLINQTDILVNLGNAVHNQMPSKIIRYIASGKPILNISAIPDCNTLPLLVKYPLCFQTYADEEMSEDFCKRFVQFCYNTKGKTIEWEQLIQRYPELQVEEIAKKFVRFCSNITN